MVSYSTCIRRFYRYKVIQRSAQSTTGLGATSLTSKVNQALLIDEKQPKKTLTRDQDN